MAGTVKANVVQLGDSGTATSNFVIRTNGDGTAVVSRGNEGATTQDIIEIGADGDVKLRKTNATSMVRIHTANGYGTTNNVIRRFSTIVTNQGTDITYADSAALGASFTINKDGVYAITYADNFSAAAATGLSVNSTQLTTSIRDITAINRLTSTSTATGTNFVETTSWTGYLVAGDVVRAHTDGAGGGLAAVSQFTIVRVA